SAPAGTETGPTTETTPAQAGRNRACWAAPDDGRKNPAAPREVRPRTVTFEFNADKMNFREAVLIALSSLRANRLRSLLTLLGIVIGVMAVIAVVLIIFGLNDFVAGKIFNLGPDVISV